MISGVHRGYVYIPGDARKNRLQLAAGWPVGGPPSETATGFAEKAFDNGRSVLHKASDELDAAGEVRDFITFPITLGERRLGVVALVLDICSEPQRQAVLQLVEWGTTWLEKTLLGLHTDRRGDSRIALQAVEILAGDAPLPVVAHQFCNLLAERFACARVALGFTKGMQVQLSAMSDQVAFDRRTALANAIQTAMEECIDQDEAVCVPPRPGPRHGLNRANKRLLQQPGQAAVCSVPVSTEDQVVGAVTLIWDDEELVDSTLVSRLGDLLTQLAPLMALKRRDARSLWRRAGSDVRSAVRRLLGGEHLQAKLVVGALLVGLAASSLVQTDLRITAEATIEGTTQQAVVAPVSGYLLSASARAGDRVDHGQVLATIDDRELRLEQQKWQSEFDKHAKEYQEALGARERAKISIAQARMAQSEAQLKLVADQLERTRLRAPFAGTLVSGDLSRAVGAPLERGQLLFEIVPAGSYRVNLQVDERDIAGLAVGQSGELRLAAMPDRAIALDVTRIVPLATADQSGNRFRVEAALPSTAELLRPGMHGVAKVVTGESSMLHAWTAELLDRVKFWLWSLGF